MQLIRSSGVTGVSVFRLQVLVLLDVTPDQSMMDEGVAREVINRIQKLRKKVVDE